MLAGNSEDIALIQRAVKTPIATGERLIGVHAFRELLEKRAASVIQPDITHCGGLSEARRIAALADAYRVALAPHNPQGPVSTAASLEFGFATPSYIICESVHADVPWRSECSERRVHGGRHGRIVRLTIGQVWESKSTKRKSETSLPAGITTAQLLSGWKHRRLVNS